MKPGDPSRGRRVRLRDLLPGRLGAALGLAAGLAASSPHAAFADVAPPPASSAPAAPAPTPPPALTAPPPPEAVPSPKRAIPDYEGRAPAPTSAGDVLLWVPRIVFSPVYFVTEFVIRRPLGAAITAAERGNLPTALYNFFAFGPDHKAGFAPLLFLDFGFHPSAGVYLFWDDAFFKGNDLRIHASTWGLDWVAGTFTQRFRLSHAKTLTLTVAGIRRPDHVYYGLGPSTLQSSQSRYGEDRVEVAWTLNMPLWRSSRVETALGIRTATFYDGHFGGDPTVTDQVRAGVFALPPGFESRYTAQTSHVLAAFDTRRTYPAPGSGVRVEAQALLGNNVNESPASAWLRIDDGAAAYLDLDGHRRVVSLGVETSFSNPFGSGTIPFTELVSLGGDFAPMPGFFPGRLVDRSAAVATLRYRWPIGPELSGSLQASVGNVFGVDLDGFEPKLLRLAGALGIQSDTSPDSDIHFLIGFGTETFDHGGQVDSFRLAFGTSRF